MMIAVTELFVVERKTLKFISLHISNDTIMRTKMRSSYSLVAKVNEVRYYFTM
jgi:hypothetical protein